MNRFLLLFLCAIFCSPAICSAESGFEGLDGKGIAQKIADEYRPLKYLTTDKELRSAVARYACLDNGTYFDYFSNSTALKLDKLDLLPVAAKQWWSESMWTLVSSDLNNIVPANFDVASNRQDYIPGLVTEVIYDNGQWRSGIGYIDGFDTNVFEPADNLKGDFARIYMLMALLYPQQLWLNRGVMLYLSTYPFLNKYGRELLMKWHREDPPDEFELRRNDVIRDVQGVGNPLVEYPELAEYLWGVNVGELFDEDSEPSAEVPGTDIRQPQPLKAVYSKAEDRCIDLKSPYVEAGASWSIDDRAVSDPIDLNGVGEGRHELKYRGLRSHGKLIITVVP